MPSFYHSITGYFEKGNHGRFLCILLSELARHEPHSFAALVEANDSPKDSKRFAFWKRQAARLRNAELSVKREVPFIGREGKRRADLALLFGKELVATIEVKEFDGVRSEHNRGQLEDYLSLITSSLGFIYVYRFLPDDETKTRLESVRAKDKPVVLLSYDRIHSTLSKLDTTKAPLARMLCNYMEDIGVGIYSKLNLRGDDRSPAIFLLSQLLGMPHASGFKRNQSDQSVRRGAEILKLMYSNTEVLMEWIRHHNTKFMPTKSTRRLWINPNFRIKQLRDDLEKVEKPTEPQEFPRKMWRYVTDGDVYFESSCGVRTPASAKQRLSLKIGISLGLRRGAKNVKIQLYAYFEPAVEVKGEEYEAVMSCNAFPSEDAARRLISKVVKDLAKAAQGSGRSVFKHVSNLKIPSTP